MFRNFILLVTTVFTFYSAWATADKMLIVETSNDGVFSFILSENPTITFNNRTMLISSVSKSESFEIEDVKQYYFTDVPASIDLPQKSNELRICRYDNGKIIILGLQTMPLVKIHSLDGKERRGNVSLSDDHAVIDLSPLSKGVYIISINNKDFKIYKR